MSDLFALASRLQLGAPRVAFFGRTSNQELQDPSLSLPRQHTSVVEATQKCGGSLVAHYWDIETGFKKLDARGNGADGTLFNVKLPRDGGVHDLVAAALRGEFDIVLVESIERISRLWHDGATIERQLADADVLLLASDEPLALDPSAILTRRIKQALGEFYVHDLKQKSWAGMRENAKQGWHAGGPAPYGYALEEHPHPNPMKAKDGKKKHRLVLDPDRAAVVRQIFQWYCDEKRGLGEICQTLNASLDRFPAPTPSNRSVGDLAPTWSRATIQTILRNPKYTGLNVWNRHDKRKGKKTLKPPEEWVWSEAETHEPIVPRDLFEKVALVALANDNRSRDSGARKHLGRQAGRSVQRTYPLRGRVFCELCGRRLTGTHQKGSNWYRCQFVDGRSPSAATLTGHPKSLQVKEEPLLDAVLDFFGRRVFSPSALNTIAADLDQAQVDAADDFTKELEALRQRHATLNRQIDRLWIEIKKAVDPDDPIAERAREELRSLSIDQKGVQAQIQEFETQVVTPNPVGEIEAALAALPDLSDALRSYTGAELAELFETFDLAIRYDRESHAAEVSVALIPELLTELTEKAPEATRPATGAGQRSRSIAGAGFEPATSGL